MGVTQGRLLGIARRAASRAPMEVLREAEITPQAGLAGDLRGRPGPRQVTALAREGWEAACAELGAALPWTVRRANLLVEGVRLAESAGRRLRVGPALLEICGETEPCGRMQQAAAGLRDALRPDWRGGVSCRVLEGGRVHSGDPVRIEER